MFREYEPKLLSIIRRGYPAKQLMPDITAGVITGIVALPLAIAFAIASGVKPEQGLYTAIIAGFLISVFSGSRVQIGGPTGAFIVVVYAIVQKHGLDGLIIATIMAGVMLIVMGLAKMGNAIKFIPYPVTVGFTGGIAVIIAVNQIRDFLGLSVKSVPAEFIEKIHVFWTSFHTINYYTLVLGVVSILLIVLFRKYCPKIPGSLVVILVGTLVVQLFNLPVETIGSRFGSVPSSLPKPVVPHWDLATVINLFPAALTIALLAGIESLLSAVVADGMIGTRHRSNAELIGQGIANIITPLFGGIPATGAIARTATNIKSGGRTPIAGIVHAVTLLLILLLFGRWAALIPMASLAAILLVVAYNMSEWHLFVKLRRGPKSDFVVLVCTFLLTVLIDLTVAIEVGVVLAAFLFMHRMQSVAEVKLLRDRTLDDEEEVDDLYSLRNYKFSHKIEIFEINGPFFFGAATKFKDAVINDEKNPPVLILRMRNVDAIDATGLQALEEIIYSMRKKHTLVLISGIRPQPLKAIKKAGLIDVIGHENFKKNIETALKRAEEIVQKKQ